MAKKTDPAILTKDQAKKILAIRKGDFVHTFLNAPFGLIGADQSLIFKPVDFLIRSFSGVYKPFFQFSTGNNEKKYNYFDDFIYVEVKSKWNN